MRVSPVRRENETEPAKIRALSSTRYPCAAPTMYANEVVLIYNTSPWYVSLIYQEPRS